MPLVEINSVSKSYPRRMGLHTTEQTVVDNVPLTIQKGETLGLAGESGSGKTTLARYLSTRIAVMEHGRLVETGEAEALCAHPRKAYTRQLIAATPELPAGVA